VEQIESYQRHIRGKPAAVGHRAEYIWSPDPDRQTAWSGERFSQVLKRETAIGLHGQRLGLQAYRDIAIAISRRYLRPSSHFKANVEEKTEDIDDEGRIDDDGIRVFIADIQAAHSASIAGTIYGRMMMENPNSTARHRELFRESSQDWHHFLGFASTQAPQEHQSAGTKCRPNLWVVEAAEAHIQRRYQLYQTDMAEVFQQMMGSSAMALCGPQEPVLQAIKHGDSCIVVVMPTGGGKSVLFMLPAWVSGSAGLTIVVVPLIVLRREMMVRCQDLGIRCAAWDPQRPPDGASIVLVTPETIPGEMFVNFVNRQRILQRLDRIVVDECHVILSQNPAFRPLLQQIGALRAASTQMVLLTAILPPGEEQILWYCIDWQREHVSLYRSPTSRYNIVYRVHTIPVDDGFDKQFQWVEMPSVIRFIQDRIRRAYPGRVIVYGTVQSYVTRVAEQLGCPVFYRQAIDKDRMLEIFRRQPGAVIAATSVLGIDIDIPDIRSVIYVGQPRNILDYAQESGRAGRDGQRSETIIVQAEGRTVGREIRPFWIQDTPGAEYTHMVVYMEAAVRGCRRVVLDGYLDGAMDGYQRQRCGDRVIESMCDGCQADWEDTESRYGSVSPVIEYQNYIDNTVIPDGDIEMVDSDYGESARRSMEIPYGSGRDMDRSGSDSGSGSIISQIPYEAPSAIRTASVRSPRAVSPSIPVRNEQTIPMYIRYQFRQQDIERARIAQRYPGPTEHRFEDEIFLAQEVEKWVHRCWICTQMGYNDGYEMWRCGYTGAGMMDGTIPQASKDWMVQVRRQIQYTDYSTYFGYGMPQYICPLGDPGMVHGADVRARCAGYRTVLIPMIAMMVHGPRADGEVQQRWYQRLAVSGVVNPEGDDAGIIRYLGQTAQGTGQKRSQLTEEFIWLRRVYHGREKWSE